MTCSVWGQINWSWQDERTALLLAAQHGHRVLMKPLLDHGADMYHCDRASGMFMVSWLHSPLSCVVNVVSLFSYNYIDCVLRRKWCIVSNS